jgi:hypothetical protein
VDHRFEELKRYNISEIFDPTPKEAVKEEEEKPQVTAKVETEVSTIVDDEASKATTEDVVGIAITHDDVSNNDKGDVSAIKDELQADVLGSSAGTPLATDE